MMQLWISVYLWNKPCLNLESGIMAATCTRRQTVVCVTRKVAWYHTSWGSHIRENRQITFFKHEFFCWNLEMFLISFGHILIVRAIMESSNNCGNWKWHLIKFLSSRAFERCHDDVIKWKQFTALLPLCEGNPPVTDGFPSQRTVTRSFDVFFDRRMNKRLSKQSRHRWFDTPSRSL